MTFYFDTKSYSNDRRFEVCIYPVDPTENPGVGNISVVKRFDYTDRAMLPASIRYNVQFGGGVDYHTSEDIEQHIEWQRLAIVFAGQLDELITTQKDLMDKFEVEPVWGQYRVVRAK